MGTDDPVGEKVRTLFSHVPGGDASKLEGGRFPQEVRSLVAEVLRPDFGKKLSQHIAFHLLDWNGDAAFLVALLLWPKEFTNEDSDGIICRILL